MNFYAHINVVYLYIQVGINIFVFYLMLISDLTMSQFLKHVIKCNISQTYLQYLPLKVN